MVLVCVLVMALWCPAVAAADTPNFVIIFVDDMGYGDIGPFGSTKNRTPHLDRMAEEGMKLTSLYAAPLCSPSRAALMTGSYAKRVGLSFGSWAGVLFPGDEQGISADEVTIAEVLKTRDYATACIGKWHLGDQPEFLPTRHGFDYFYGLPYSNDMIPDGIQTIRKYPPLALLRNEEVLGEEKDQATLTSRYVGETVKFIREHRGGPFFVYLAHTMVHVPLYASEGFRGKSANGILGDAVEEIDWGVGEILGTLRELGLAENTLVIFTSDNGPARGSAGPLRGRKGSTWEGGMREPALAWWPGEIPPGSSSGEITSTMDFLPTFAALAEAELPAGRKIDGGNIAPILRGMAGARTPYEKFFYYRGMALRAVRSGDWKLHASGELYNLDRDIGEQEDVSAANLDVVKRLEAYLEEGRRDLGDGERAGAGVRPEGVVDDPRFLIPRPGKTGAAAHEPIYKGPLPKGLKRPANW